MKISRKIVRMDSLETLSSRALVETTPLSKKQITAPKKMTEGFTFSQNSATTTRAVTTKTSICCGELARSSIFDLLQTRTFHHKPGVEEAFLVVLEFPAVFSLIHPAAGIPRNGMTGSRVPFHGRCQPGVQIRPSLRHQAKFQGTSHGDGIHRPVLFSFFLNNGFGFRTQVGAACYNRVVTAAVLNGQGLRVPI